MLKIFKFVLLITEVQYEAIIKPIYRCEAFAYTLRIKNHSSTDLKAKNNRAIGWRIDRTKHNHMSAINTFILLLYTSKSL